MKTLALILTIALSATVHAEETKTEEPVQKTEMLTLAFFAVQDDCNVGEKLDVFELRVRVIPFANESLKLDLSNGLECMASIINGHYQCVAEQISKVTKNGSDKPEDILSQFIFRFKKVPEAMMGILELNIDDKCQSRWVILTKPKGQQL